MITRSTTNSRLVYAISGTLATISFFLPWMTFHIIGMPDYTDTVSTWSGWSNPLLLPLGVLILAVSVVAVIVSATNQPLPVLVIRIMTLAGLFLLISTTFLMLPDAQAIPVAGPPPQFDFGLVLTYIGYAGMIIGSFVLARRSRKVLSR